MKLAFSNIAWPVDRQDEVAELLRGIGVGAIEAAPTKWWPAPLDAPIDALQRTREWWEARALPIVAAQALLFGRPDLTLFESEATRLSTLDYLVSVAARCGALGAGPLVFGAPANRRRGDLHPEDANRIAIEFFRLLADAAAQSNTVIVLEANPPNYGTDFINRAGDALALVRAVNHPNFRLHLDTACMTIAGDEPDVIVRGADVLAHFHVSEPLLAPVGDGTAVDHEKFAAALRRANYRGWISIEMRQPDPFTLDALERAAARTRRIYGTA